MHYSKKKKVLDLWNKLRGVPLEWHLGGYRNILDRINAFDLEAIILGGGVSNLPIWYQRVPSYVQERLFGAPRDNIPIIKAQLGDSAGVVGAAYLALRDLGYMEF